MSEAYHWTGKQEDTASLLTFLFGEGFACIPFHTGSGSVLLTDGREVAAGQWLVRGEGGRINILKSVG